MQCVFDVVQLISVIGIYARLAARVATLTKM